MSLDHPMGIGSQEERLKPRNNILAVVKNDGERYIFVYDNHSREQLIQLLASYADNPDLSFNWDDASVLTQKASDLKAQE